MVVGEFAEQRDLIVIGGGPGGYNAAIRAAQLGIKVTLIEQEKLGGVCLNQGCIPSKTFAHAAKQFASMAHMAELGITTNECAFDIAQLAAYKDKTVSTLRKGVAELCKVNKIEILEGKANFTGKNKIGVENGHRFDLYEFNHCIIATGSTTIIPEHLAVKDPRIVTPHDIYNLMVLPEELIVYGNDYISLEVAFSFNKLGSKVKVILDEQDYPFDETINRELRRVMKKEKIKVYRGTQIMGVNVMGEKVEVQLTDQEADSGTHLFISGKCQPNMKDLGIDRFGVKLSENGFIETDETMRTSLENTFAVGDVTTGPALAVKAIKQGKVAAETIADVASEVDITFIPTIVHTTPPIATVGLTEAEAKDQGYTIKSSHISLSGNGYAMISNEKTGVIKVISDVETELLLGIHIFGAGAVELINTGVTALEMVARETDLEFPLYPHPSFNEAIIEAVEDLNSKAIHQIKSGI